MAGVLATAVAAGVLTVTPANAVIGDEAKNGTYAFTAKLDIGGGQRSCTAALVEQQWLVTAASCFADNPAQGSKVAAGAPKLKTTAAIGGSTVDIVELVPREGRDLVMAKLAKPVTGVAPAEVGTKPLAQGEELRVAGFGRTKDEWVPDKLHSSKFSVGAVREGSVDLVGANADAAVCKGDTGGPALREAGGRYELVGVNSRSWQGGCLGNEDETRKGAVDTRVDDIAGWIQSVSSRTLLSRANWNNAAHMASGRFTNGGAADSKRRMDLFVAWKDGSASIFQGADHNDPKYPFSAEYKVASAGSYWKDARAVTAGNFTGSGSDGITVRWVSGKLSTYTHVDQNGFHEEKTLARSDTWKRARLITAGRYTGNALRDDLLVLWDNGSTSMYSDTDTNGVSKETQLTWADKGWENAAQISSGEFTGGKTADLVIRWNDGDTTIFPTVDTAGYHGRTRIRDVGSAWKNAQVLTVGSFTAAANRPNDILIRWSDGNLSYYPGVDAAGTHGEVQLVG